MIISKHRREDIFVDNYFVCADARVKRVRVEMYTANLGVCMSVSTPSPMILKLCMHNPHLKSEISNKSQCLKITEKVAFNIASEARYVYMLSGHKFNKNAKNGPFWRVFENLKLAVEQCYQTGHF